jgi:prepilin-type processing-associated H-X9-DG protein
MTLTATKSRVGWWGTVAVLVAVPVFLLQLSPAGSSSSQVTRGEFGVFAAGAGDARFEHLQGHAQMVRAADGKTIVTVEVTGLVPGITYPVHVHAAACNAGFADGHFKFDPSGAADSYNELWPGFTANAAGAGNGRAVADRTAGANAVSVVIHSPDATPAPKVACADLN